MAIERIQFRRDDAADWAQNNPVLASGEPAWDTTVRKLKIGDGVTAWAALPYIEPGTAAAASSLTELSDYSELLATLTTITDSVVELQGGVKSTSVTSIVVLSESAYAALEETSATTLYLVTPEQVDL